MADGGIYRAVFLRMHPTGKAVLSLSEQSKGEEARLAEIASEELGIPPEDIKVKHEDNDRFGEGNSYNSAPCGAVTAPASRNRLLMTVMARSRTMVRIRLATMTSVTPISVNTIVAMPRTVSRGRVRSATTSASSSPMRAYRGCLRGVSMLETGRPRWARRLVRPQAVSSATARASMLCPIPTGPSFSAVFAFTFT